MRVPDERAPHTHARQSGQVAHRRIKPMYTRLIFSRHVV